MTDRHFNTSCSVWERFEKEVGKIFWVAVRLCWLIGIDMTFGKRLLQADMMYRLRATYRVILLKESEKSMIGVYFLYQYFTGG